MEDPVEARGVDGRRGRASTGDDQVGGDVEVASGVGVLACSRDAERVGPGRKGDGVGATPAGADVDRRVRVGRLDGFP